MISVREYDYVSGILRASLLYPSGSGTVTLLRTFWFMYLGGTSASPWLLKHLEVGNTSGGALTFRMALMTVDDGTPGTSNAFLAWDRQVAPGEVWTWKGEVPLSGRYFYGKASGAGVTIYICGQEGVG
jgi:hypothetical protein